MHHLARQQILLVRKEKNISLDRTLENGGTILKKKKS